MSDKFLGNGGSNINLSNGTATIFGATIGALSLDPSKPIKTNSVRQLVSSKLDIADINSLQSQLSTKDELTFTEGDTHTTPLAGKVVIYAKTDGEVYKKDDTGTETPIGNSDTTDLETKTQNISLTETDGTKTTMTQELNLSTPASGLTVSGVLGQGSDISLTGSAGELNDGRQGFTFTIDDDIVVNRAKVRNEARFFNSGGSIGYWFRDPPSTTWNLGGASSLQSGSVGTDGNFRWTENGYPKTLLENNGRIHAFVLDMAIGGRLSADPPSALTYEAGINIIGRCYEAEPNIGTFPDIETTDGYAPVCSFEYVSNTPTYDKTFNCGSINNKSGTIINVSDPTNSQDVSTKNYVDVATSGITELETKTQNISTTTSAGNTISTGNQKILLGAAIGGDTFSITGGAVGDTFFARIMDMDGTGVNTVVPLNTGVVRPDADNVRDIGTTALKYRDIYTDKVYADKIEVSNITAPANPGSGKGVIYKKTGSNGLFYKPGASAPEVDLTAPTGYSSVNSNNTTTSSPTYVTMTGMTLTPGAGKYLVLFSGNFTHSGGKGDAYANFSIFSNGVEVLHSHRYAWLETDPTYTPLSTQAFATIADGETIDVRWRDVEGEDPRCVEKSLLLVKLNV